MKDALHITIPEPCNEQWNEMKPVAEDRVFCQSCSRVLVDFTKMDDTELALWLRNSNQKICGRFADSQLNREIVLPQSTTRRRYRLSAAWLVFLAWFSKPAAAQSSGQTTVGKPAVCTNQQNSQTTSTQTSSTSNDPVRQIAGRVMSEAGPVADALITLRKSDGSVIDEIHTDKQGYYQFSETATSKVSSGGGTVAVYSPKYSKADWTFTSPHPVMNFNLESPPVIKHTMGVPIRR